MAKTVNGSSTYNYYDGFGTLAAIRNSSGWTEEFFPTVGGRNYAKYQSGNTYFLHGDMLASSTMATNQAGSFQQDMLYYPWGGVWSQYSSVDTRFAGMLERDGESQLDPTPNRLFYNYLGRWLSPDPAGQKAVRLDDPQTWNMYTYARNNPTTLTDPSGLDPQVTGGGEAPADKDATYGAGADVHANHADSGKPGPGQGGEKKQDGQKDSPNNSPSWKPGEPLPDSPSKLGPGWKKDTKHKAPNDERFENDKGDKVDWHKGQPGENGWKGRDHWHWLPGGKKQDKHYVPGQTVKRVAVGTAIAAGTVYVITVIIDTAPYWGPILAF